MSLLTRRNLILSGGSLGLLSGCLSTAPEEPGVILAAASMTGSANPGPDGSGRPLTVTLVQLRSDALFSSADFASLQTPDSTLAADLLRADRLILAPGGSAEAAFPVEVQAGATTLGIIAGFREPSGKVFRHSLSLPASGNLQLTISVSATGLSVT